MLNNAHETSTAIQGGGILYFTLRECGFSGGFNGRGVDLLEAYADSSVHYGVNVGWFERNIFAGPQGAFRAEGIFTVRDNDFEGGSGSINPALQVSNTSNGAAIIEGNYFEMSGASQGILLNTAARAVIRGNMLYGASGPAVGSYGVKAETYTYGLDITGNSFSRFEVGINLNSTTDSGWPSFIIGANTFQSSSVSTPVAGGSVGRVSGSSAYHNESVDVNAAQGRRAYHLSWRTYWRDGVMG